MAVITGTTGNDIYQGTVGTGDVAVIDAYQDQAAFLDFVDGLPGGRAAIRRGRASAPRTPSQTCRCSRPRSATT